MTIREWIERQTPAPPAALTRQMIGMLGGKANADESELPDACLAAALEALGRLLANNRFGRDSAPELLAIDALTTCAFEYASRAPDGASRLPALADRATSLLQQLAPLRV